MALDGPCRITELRRIQGNVIENLTLTKNWHENISSVP